MKDVKCILDNFLPSLFDKLRVGTIDLQSDPNYLESPHNWIAFANGCKSEEEFRTAVVKLDRGPNVRRC